MHSSIQSWITIEFLSSTNKIDFNSKEKDYILTPENYNSFDFLKYKGCKIRMATYNTSDIYDLLSNLYKDNSFIDRKQNDISYACEFDIDLNQNLNSDSIAISSFLWAAKQLQQGVKQNLWEEAFVKYKANLVEEIGEIFKKKNMTLFEKVMEIEKYIGSELNMQTYLLHRAYFSPIKYVQKEEQTDSILNSFYTKDLTLINKTEPEKWSTGLRHYVSQQKDVNRVDVIKNTDIVKEKLSAKYIPEGSWPNAYSLSLMQQYAVNYITTNLANTSGHFSVNGPPGTGKTTLLKDAIASIIVKRAKILCEYNNPTEAFTAQERYVKTGNYKLTYYKPNGKICDDAIIVASSNNTAVENISKSLPKVDNAFGIDNYPTNIFFKEIAQLIYGEDSWNCCSFALGKSSNKTAFINIWEKWNTEKECYDKPFQEAIDSLRYTSKDWERIKCEFQECLKSFASLKEKLCNYEIILSDPTVIKLLEDFEYDTTKAFNFLNAVRKENLSRIAILTDGINELKLDFARQKELRPMFWHFWFNTLTAGNYLKEIGIINKNINDLRVGIRTLTDQNEEIDVKYTKLTEYKNIKDKFEQFTPDERFWNEAFKNEKPSTSQELSPWFNKELKRLSTNIFFKALELNTVFISLASRQIKSNIDLLICHWEGKITNIPDEELKGVWNTLFLLVPVISTTFASVGNLFKKIDGETFGWLFIDESGQAVPQAAAGAINRCKRVVAVGDPLQIEPIVTLPEKIFDYIKSENNVSKELFSTKSSVQNFFDNINPVGTYINEMWIGSPLNIHRRCLEPMFSIANGIAYDNIMQNANQETFLYKKSGLYSHYENILGSCSTKQFVPEQASRAIELIQYYYNSLDDKDEFSLFVISPFKVVISEFKRKLKIETSKNINEKLDKCIGTVHTFQGKEADVVIFLSGCDTDRMGAIHWADSTPNLLNVALTRAKKIFIAIGDKKLYKDTKYFSQMIKGLDNNEISLMNKD